MTSPPNPASTGPTQSAAPDARRSPRLITEIPGPESRALAARLAAVESRNVTALDPVPIFWERASGETLIDVDGNRFIDLTAAFGVANVGHAHPEVVDAITRQAGELLHGMGDVHPPRVKVELLERLAALYPRGEASEPPRVRTVLSSSGSDAVETALKTAMLTTGRAGILAFEGAYHGLSLGALDCTWREDFKEPFRARLPGATRFVPFDDLEAVQHVARTKRDEIAAVLVEPVQGTRGGAGTDPRLSRRPTPNLRRGGLVTHRGRNLYGPRTNRSDLRVRSRRCRSGSPLRRQRSGLGDAYVGVHGARIGIRCLARLSR